MLVKELLCEAGSVARLSKDYKKDNPSDIDYVKKIFHRAKFDNIEDFENLSDEEANDILEYYIEDMGTLINILNQFTADGKVLTIVEKSLDRAITNNPEFAEEKKFIRMIKDLKDTNSLLSKCQKSLSWHYDLIKKLYLTKKK